MKRAGNLFDQMVSFEHLRKAALRAAHGKRRARSVAAFLLDLEPEILRLRRELLAGTWRPGVPTTFTITDPKERTISAAPFSDRVVHHALMDRLEPVLERRMVYESFACRKGRGTHRARRHAQRLLRRHGWSLKLDVERFFPSLRHDVVLETIGRVVKDRQVLDLCEVLVRAGGEHGKGLPIGNLTSQWFANLVLDRLDHHVKDVLRIPGYARYMDDCLLLADEKSRLRAAERDVGIYLRDVLGLRLKQRVTRLAPAHCGVPFLGFQIYRGVLRVRPENLKRVRARLRWRAWQHENGLLAEERYRDSVRSVAAHLAHAGTLALRRRLFHESA